MIMASPTNTRQSVHRSISEPIRADLSTATLWHDYDKGLILCWEIGRQRGKKEPELAEKAKCGQLPPLGWKGGTTKALKKNEKYGTLNYLAEWQGLRGENLSIDPNEEVEITCSKTGMTVTYTANSDKYGNAS